MASWQGWESDVLTAIGAPVTAANVAFLDAWQNAEGGSAAYNPLNTTQQMSGSTDYNSAGVQEYGSSSQGANATAKTLLNGYYDSIVAALRTGDPLSGDTSSMAQELSKWGTGPAFLQNLLGGNAIESGAGSNTSGGIPNVQNLAASPATRIALAAFAFLLIGVAALALHHGSAGAQSA